jgi:hypothetical protein
MEIQVTRGFQTNSHRGRNPQPVENEEGIIDDLDLSRIERPGREQQRVKEAPSLGLYCSSRSRNRV